MSFVEEHRSGTIEGGSPPSRAFVCFFQLFSLVSIVWYEGPSQAFSLQGQDVHCAPNSIIRVGRNNLFWLVKCGIMPSGNPHELTFPHYCFSCVLAWRNDNRKKQGEREKTMLEVSRSMMCWVDQARGFSCPKSRKG